LARREEPPLRRSEGGVAPQPPERAGEIREGPAKEEASGLSERHIDAEGERRLIEAGFLPEASHVGKRRWKDPDTGRSMTGGAALDKVERREEQELEEAGWEQVEVQGRTYWCRPDTGHLYPRGPAYDVHKRRDQG
jgi:hypothetical protein